MDNSISCGSGFSFITPFPTLEATNSASEIPNVFAISFVLKFGFSFLSDIYLLYFSYFYISML